MLLLTITAALLIPTPQPQVQTRCQDDGNTLTITTQADVDRAERRERMQTARRIKGSAATRSIDDGALNPQPIPPKEPLRRIETVRPLKPVKPRAAGPLPQPPCG